jgi:Tol biopolymer transport system component
MTPSRAGALPALPAVAATVALVLLVPMHPASAAFPGKNGEITFARAASDAPSTGEIYVMRPDGSGQTRLTSNDAVDSLPAFAPDGARIAFTSRRDSQGTAVNDELYVMDAADDDGDGNGDHLTRLTSTGGENEFQPAFSPDGTRIAFTSNRDGDNDIYVMDADGTNQVRLTDNATRDARPAFSPDGRRIAFTSNRDRDDEIYVMDATDDDGDGNGDHLTKITDNAGVADTHANFSPDGELIAFTTRRDGNDEIYVANADGGGSPTRLTDNDAVDEFPAFSPDGQWVAFSSNRAGGGPDYDIYTMRVAREDAGNAPERLTNTPEADSKPDWGPAFYDFGGFYAPVDNLPVSNAVQAGRAVPIKFDLGGDEGLDILAAGSPLSRRIDCDSAAPVDDIEQTATAGESGLSYDADAGRYAYVWKTEKGWSGTCRQFVLALDDGTVHRANFRFS